MCVCVVVLRLISRVAAFLSIVFKWCFCCLALLLSPRATSFCLFLGKIVGGYIYNAYRYRMLVRMGKDNLFGFFPPYRVWPLIDDGHLISDTTFLTSTFARLEADSESARVTRT